MSEERLWWKHGVIYQIYPRSFFDTNNDGAGDIPGITAKLDYLKELGVEGLWLSPINKSPMYDFGYDISDYEDIDPVFGTLKDYESLIKEAHARGLKVIMDLVMNHTSHLHPWFIESSSSKDNPKRDWYIWKDKVCGQEPNNWRAVFGGRAWEWDEKTSQYYLHLFLKEQPDINWRNPELKKAVFNMIRFWLDKGVDGFRLDVCNFYVKDKQFRNNPFKIGHTPRPYDMQEHAYDINQPETLDILKEFRKFVDSYPERMSVGEVASDPPGNPGLSASYYCGGQGLHLNFNFAQVFCKWGAKSFHDSFGKWIDLVPSNSWPCNVLNNHDQPRSFSRFGGGPAAFMRSKLAAVMLLTLKGTPFIYYGEEIGMGNGTIPRNRIVDPVGIKYWPLHPGRDPERTPMQWNATEHAGFSKANPWLPVNANYQFVNVEAQLRDNKSMLNLYKNLIRLRKEYPVLENGEGASITDGSNDVWAYTRYNKDNRALIALNFSCEERKTTLGVNAAWRVIFSTHRETGPIISEAALALAPYEATVIIQALT